MAEFCVQIIGQVTNPDKNVNIIFELTNLAADLYG